MTVLGIPAQAFRIRSDILRLLVLKDLLTEQRNPASTNIDRLPTAELLRVINREDQTVALAVEKEIPRIVQAIDGIVERFSRGGRLYYLGAGTSGRLGVLDAAECPPTFGVSADRVQAIVAGGDPAVFRAAEGAEDRTENGEADLRSKGLGAADAVVGISASGRTPYVLGGLAYARSLGALTVGLTTNPESELAVHAEILIAPVTGPEVITGSTRMKSGTAQKLVLNMISTAVMEKMGYVLGNLMVNVQLKSEKLVDRGRRIIEDVTGCSATDAAEALAAAGNNVRLAIVMAKLGLDCQAAEERLAKAGDHLGEVLKIS
jgi:N-acetylmuramic acid 6-phosphate etherase